MPYNISHYDLPIFLYLLMQSENIFDLRCIDVLEFLDMDCMIHKLHVFIITKVQENTKT